MGAAPASRIAAHHANFLATAICELQLILRSCRCGVRGAERMPCAYFAGKNRVMKAKGIIIPKDKIKEFVEFQKMLPVGKTGAGEVVKEEEVKCLVGDHLRFVEMLIEKGYEGAYRMWSRVFDKYKK